LKWSGPRTLAQGLAQLKSFARFDVRWKD
jgi:hypothetical protein